MFLRKNNNLRGFIWKRTWLNWFLRRWWWCHCSDRCWRSRGWISWATATIGTIASVTYKCEFCVLEHELAQLSNLGRQSIINIFYISNLFRQSIKFFHFILHYLGNLLQIQLETVIDFRPERGLETTCAARGSRALRPSSDISFNTLLRTRWNRPYNVIISLSVSVWSVFTCNFITSTIQYSQARTAEFLSN